MAATEELRKEKCVACRAGAATVTKEELAELLPQVPEWKVVARDGIDTLERVYSFPDFSSAMAFSVRVGMLAEAEGHRSSCRPHSREMRGRRTRKRQRENV